MSDVDSDNNANGPTLSTKASGLRRCSSKGLSTPRALYCKSGMLEEQGDGFAPERLTPEGDNSQTGYYTSTWTPPAYPLSRGGHDDQEAGGGPIAGQRKVSPQIQPAMSDAGLGPIEKDIAVLRKRASRSAFPRLMETISENSVETELGRSAAQPCPTPPGPPSRLRAKRRVRKAAADRGGREDPDSYESLAVFGTLSREERSIVDAMNTYLSIASGDQPSPIPPSPELTPISISVADQNSFASIKSTLDPSNASESSINAARDALGITPAPPQRESQPWKTLLPLPNIDTSQAFTSFAAGNNLRIPDEVAEETSEVESYPTDATTSGTTTESFLLDTATKGSAARSNEGRHYSLSSAAGPDDMQPRIYVPAPPRNTHKLSRHRGRIGSWSAALIAREAETAAATMNLPPSVVFDSAHRSLMPELKMNTGLELDFREPDAVSSMSSRRRAGMWPAEFRGRSRQVLQDAASTMALHSMTDSGVQADEEDNDGNETPRAVTLTHDRMMEAMEGTPLHKAIYQWHIEERFFTYDLTAFACDPRTNRSVGFLSPVHRRRFQRLHNPLVAFGYEIQRYCMRYISGYDLSLQIKELQEKQEGRDDKGKGKGKGKEKFRDSGIGSDFGSQNCGCQSGRSCLQAGSSKERKERQRTPTPPPRLRLPIIEGEDYGEEFVAGLGITQDLLFSTASLGLFGQEEEVLDAPEISDSPPTSRLRKVSNLKCEEFGHIKGEAVDKASEPGGFDVAPSSPITAISVSPLVPARKMRKKRAYDDCPRLPRLELPDIGEGSIASSRSMVSMTTQSEQETSTGTKQTSARTKQQSVQVPEPLTEAEAHRMIVAIRTTMQALVVMRDFMADLDDVFSVVKHPNCKPAVREKARDRLFNELLPQCEVRVSATISVLEEQAGIIGEILDGPPPSPLPDSEGSRMMWRSSGKTNKKKRQQQQRPGEQQQHELEPEQGHRGTSAWARNTATEGTMTGGLPPRKMSFAASLLGPSPLYPHNLDHPLLRPFARLCGVCTRVRFRALRQLARFPFLDRFTYWSLSRLDERLDRLRVHDGHSGAGSLCAMRYTVAGIAQDIIARRGRKHIGIADTEERVSLDTNEWDEVDRGWQIAWVSRVLGPRGGKNAAGWDEEAEVAGWDDRDSKRAEAEEEERP